MAAKCDLIDLDLATLELLLDHIEANLGKAVAEPLRRVVDAYAQLVELLRHTRISLRKLQRLLFGAKTERTSTVVGQKKDAGVTPEGQTADREGGGPNQGSRRRGNGHGRHGAKEYFGCRKVKVGHESLHHGDPCPHCSGKVYQLKRAAQLVRLTGQTPIHGTVYELQQLRCGLCQEVFTASWPEGVDEQKYDAKAVGMLALLHYGQGMSGNCLAVLQKAAGIPLPSATQWELLRDRAAWLAPLLDYLLQEAAQGSVLHHDDTNARVLALMDKQRRREVLGEEEPGRCGIFTTGIVAVCEGHLIALYLTGPRHAGENLRELLKRRAQELPWPIQMCDPSSRNMPKDLQTILANCLTHGRRQFVEIAEVFPQEVCYVLEALKQVYQVDAEAKQRELTAEQRLSLHQEKSGPVMESLHQWLTEQLEQKKVEPNGALGKAMAYMLRHWSALTLFLRQPGAPLDNNICERALKKAIRYRKNSLFYKTLNGAHVGDLYMSLIQTCLLCHADPFDYLTQVILHHEQAAQNPGTWMPWNYQTQPRAMSTGRPATEPAITEVTATPTPQTFTHPAATPEDEALPSATSLAATVEPSTVWAGSPLPTATSPPSAESPRPGTGTAPSATAQPVAARRSTTPAPMTHTNAEPPPSTDDKSMPVDQPPLAQAGMNPAARTRAGPA